MSLDGSADGYRAGRTLTVAAEFRRQATRRRTHLTFGFMVALPLIILAAFQVGWGTTTAGRQRSVLQPDRARHHRRAQLRPLHDLRLGQLPAGRGGGAVLRGHRGQRGELGFAAVSAGRAGPAGPAAGRQAGWSGSATARWRSALTGTALLAGTLRYGWGPLRSTVVGGSAAGRRHWCGCGAVVGYLAVTLLVVASLAFLLSVLTDAPLGAVGGAVLLVILSNILDQITALGALRTAAHPLRRRLAGAARHPGAGRRRGQGDDLGSGVRQCLRCSRLVAVRAQGHPQLTRLRRDGGATNVTRPARDHL